MTSILQEPHGTSSQKNKPQGKNTEKTSPKGDLMEDNDTSSSSKTEDSPDKKVLDSTTEDETDCSWSHFLQQSEGYSWEPADTSLHTYGYGYKIENYFGLEPIDTRFLRDVYSQAVIALCKDGVYAFEVGFGYAFLVARRKSRALQYLHDPGDDVKREGPVRRCGQPYNVNGHDLFTYGDSTSEEEEEEEELVPRSVKKGKGKEVVNNVVSDESEDSSEDSDSTGFEHDYEYDRGKGVGL